MLKKIVAWIVGALAILNTFEGIIHLVVAFIGFWGAYATNVWDWRLLTAPVENLIFGLFSLFTGVILGKGLHNHHHHSKVEEVKEDYAMPKCPKCRGRMGWVGDHDTMEDDLYSTHYRCAYCHVEMFEYWGEGVDKL